MLDLSTALHAIRLVEIEAFFVSLNINHLVGRLAPGNRNAFLVNLHLDHGVGKIIVVGRLIPVYLAFRAVGLSLLVLSSVLLDIIHCAIIGVFFSVHCS